MPHSFHCQGALQLKLKHWSCQCSQAGNYQRLYAQPGYVQLASQQIGMKCLVLPRVDPSWVDQIAGIAVMAAVAQHS